MVNSKQSMVPATGRTNRIYSLEHGRTPSSAGQSPSKLKVIHIGGTNGEGSTIAFLNAEGLG